MCSREYCLIKKYTLLSISLYIDMLYSQYRDTCIITHYAFAILQPELTMVIQL